MNYKRALLYCRQVWVSYIEDGYSPSILTPSNSGPASGPASGLERSRCHSLRITHPLVQHPVISTPYHLVHHHSFFYVHIALTVGGERCRPDGMLMAFRTKTETGNGSRVPLGGTYQHRIILPEHVFFRSREKSSSDKKLIHIF